MMTEHVARVLWGAAEGRQAGRKRGKGRVRGEGEGRVGRRGKRKDT